MPAVWQVTDVREVTSVQVAGTAIRKNGARNCLFALSRSSWLPETTPLGKPSWLQPARFLSAGFLVDA